MSRTTELTCITCGKSFAAPAGREAAGLVEEESSRCSRLREINEQRKALDVARAQGGFAGVPGGESDTVDLLAHRESMSRLDSALKKEADVIIAAMLHEPAS